MLSMFDIIAGANAGKGLEAFAGRFGLSPAQAENALDSLMPVFREALRRRAGDPWGLGDMMRLFAGSAHVPHFDDPAGRAAADAGQDVVARLFGSTELANALAAQAAAAAGIGQDVMRRMLPVAAAALAGGYQKQASTLAEAWAEIARESVQAFAGQTPPGGQTGVWPGGRNLPGDDGLGPMADNPWLRAMQVAFAPLASSRPQPSPPPAATDVWAEWWRNWAQLTGAPGSAPPSAAKPAERPPPNPYDQIFARLFDTGRLTRDEYQRAIESLFDRFQSAGAAR